ncbi:hypothetical protein QF026_004594 [Streptomyces aurantiacus]|nr:hypothetical protein [Streptomyces aurantiacus]
MPAVHYESYTEARAHLKDLLDAAGEGRVATVRRDADCAAVVDAERLRHYLSLACSAKAQAVAESGGWSIFIPGLPGGSGWSVVRRGDRRDGRCST